MNTTDDRSFMAELCKNQYTKGISRPFSVDGFDCATTGHALLMMPGATFEPNPEAPPLEKVLGIPLTKVATTSFQALLHWGVMAGRLHHICNFCATEEADEPEITIGMLAGRTVNRRLIGLFLASLQADTVNIHIGAELDPLLIECADWRLYVMPVKRVPGDDFEFPLEAVK